jgi:hypothetical protein
MHPAIELSQSRMEVESEDLCRFLCGQVSRKDQHDRGRSDECPHAYKHWQKK